MEHETLYPQETRAVELVRLADQYGTRDVPADQIVALLHDPDGKRFRVFYTYSPKTFHALKPNVHLTLVKGHRVVVYSYNTLGRYRAERELRRVLRQNFTLLIDVSDESATRYRPPRPTAGRSPTPAAHETHPTALPAPAPVAVPAA
jgi:hypothetical protein